MPEPLLRGTSDRLAPRFLICLYQHLFIYFPYWSLWILNKSNMVYCLSYYFKGKAYSIKVDVQQKGSTDQLETIAEGLALSSAEQNNHKSYGIYTDMSLFEDGKLVWCNKKRIISKNISCNFITHAIFKLLLIVTILIIGAKSSHLLAQSSSCYTSYTWDNWKSREYEWKFCYSNGWVYVYPVYSQPKDFYFRFKYNDLGLRELTRSEWKDAKGNNGWVEKYCTFEYYITDEHQTMKSCLQVYGYPCAKEKVSYGKPSVIKSEYVKTNVAYTDDDEVRTLNFFFSDGSAFAITVHWDYSGSNMKYTY